MDRSVRDETESCPSRSVREELDDLEAQQDNGIDECFLVSVRRDECFLVSARRDGCFLVSVRRDECLLVSVRRDE